MTAPKTTIMLAASCMIVGCAASEPAPAKSSVSWNTLNGQQPIVIAHRGASAYLPGHTLEAYELGIDQGADFVEPDLVLTKDDVLVSRHDRYLSTTTNVADHPEFADREVEKEGRTDWWVEDFTLAEIKTLRARQDSERRSHEHDDEYSIPTFDEVIELVKRRSADPDRVVGVYPELKHAAAFAAMGKDIGSALIEALDRAGWNRSDAPVIIQSFEAPVLQALNARIDLPLIQLTFPKRSLDEAEVPESVIELEAMTAYADGVGPSRMLIVHEDGAVTDFVARAHELGLEVHVWTLAGDQGSPDGLSPEDETRRMYDLGVDAVFADDPAQAVRIRAERN